MLNLEKKTLLVHYDGIGEESYKNSVSKGNTSLEKMEIKEKGEDSTGGTGIELSWNCSII